MTLTEREGSDPLPPFLLESFSATLNNSEAVMLEQARLNLRRSLPRLREMPAHDRPMILVAGGPSLEDELLALRFMQGDVFALNGVHDYLIERNLIPDAMVLLDSREESAAFVRKPHPDVAYYLAAVCHPSAFDRLAGHKAVLWINDLDGMEKVAPTALRVGGGATVGLKALYLGYLLGYRTFHLFGFDSCYRGEANHAYPQPLNDGEARMDVELNGEVFVCAPWMAKQAKEFERQTRVLTDIGCEIQVHGKGLIASVARHMAETFAGKRAGQEIRAVYDLARCPASFDFIQWLINVEIMRKAWGCTGFKVHIKPGPNCGFRADDFPEPVESRTRMLENVMRPAIRMFGAEECDDGEDLGIPYVFRQTASLTRAGMAMPRLSIDADALEWAGERYPDKPVVVSLREAEYWPERNSNLLEWMNFADCIERRVVFVRDTDLAHDDYHGFETCPEASLDLHKRAALYRSAGCILGVGSGPNILAYASDTPFAAFIWEIPHYVPWTRDGFLAICGLEWGRQPGFFKPNQRIVYERDNLAAILRAYETITKETA